MVNRKRKKNKIGTGANNVSVYNVWQQYEQFVRSLYIESPQKTVSQQSNIKKFIKKLIVVAIGAFFTTIAFNFFINPNKIYNPGLNGLIQKFAQWWVGSGEGQTTSTYYYLVYYGTGLVTNSLIIFVL
jgi:hypothetical protein